MHEKSPSASRSPRFSRCLFGTIAVIATAAACNGNPAALADPDAPDQVLLGVRHMMTADGVVHARIDVDSAYLFADRGVLQLFGVSGALLDPPYVNPVATLTAPRGEVDLRANRLTASGGAEAASTLAALTVTAEALVLDPRAGRLSSVGPATVRDGLRDRIVERFDGDLRLRP